MAHSRKVMVFFIGGDIAETANDGDPLLYELEQQSKAFGAHLFHH